MLQEMSWREWWDWQAFAELEPFDEEREDIRNAHIVQTLVNINRDPKKHTPFPISDFILKIGDVPEHKKKQTWQEQKRIGRMYYEESLKKGGTRVTRPKGT